MLYEKKDYCKPDSLVFCVPDATGEWKPLTKQLAQSVLESQISGMGLNPAKYRFHGFRHGSIQAACLVEPNLQLARLQSDHVSDAINVYTALPGHRRFGVAAKLTQQLQCFSQRSQPTQCQKSQYLTNKYEYLTNVDVYGRLYQGSTIS